MRGTSQERWFLLLLGGSVLALGYVLSPFLYTFAIASVLVVISWQPYLALTARLGGRPRLAAGLCTLAVALIVAVPVALVLFLAGLEVVALAQRALETLTSSAPLDWLEGLEASYAELAATDLGARLPDVAVVADYVAHAVEGLAIDASLWLGSALPTLVGLMWRASVDLVVLCIAVYLFYVSGPELLRSARSLAPLPDEYVDRVFGVFRQFASNVAVGMVAAGAVQGLVAALGFWLAGVPGELVLGLVTAVTSVVPIVGSAVVWLPVAIVLALQGSWGAAVFITVWSLAVTASADNVIKPLLYRNQLQVSPILMLLALFGGLLVMGAQGLVFGPSVLVLTLTLHTLYVRDFQPAPAEEVPAAASPSTPEL